MCRVCWVWRWVALGRWWGGGGIMVGGGIMIHPARGRRQKDLRVCEAEGWRHRHVSLLQTAQEPSSKAQEEDALNVVAIDVPTSVRKDNKEEGDSGEAGTEGEGRLIRQQSLRTRHLESEGSFSWKKKRWRMPPWQVVCSSAPGPAELRRIKKRWYPSFTLLLPVRCKKCTHPRNWRVYSEGEVLR